MAYAKKTRCQRVVRLVAVALLARDLSPLGSWWHSFPARLLRSGRYPRICGPFRRNDPSGPTVLFLSAPSDSQVRAVEPPYNRSRCSRPLWAAEPADSTQVSVSLRAAKRLQKLRETCRQISPETFWLICWSLGGLLAMSLIPSKRVDRIFPILPPLCLVLAAQVGHALRMNKRARALSLERDCTGVVNVVYERLRSSEDRHQLPGSSKCARPFRKPGSRRSGTAPLAVCSDPGRR